jgi:hypothetical protein
MASRLFGILVAVIALPTAAVAQSHNLVEAPAVGECFRVSIETNLSGTMKVVHDGKEEAVKLTAKNEHAILERVLKADKGLARKSARYYEKAVCAVAVGNDRFKRGLRDDRRLIVAQRAGDDLLCYSPAGPFTRQELEVASEHFDTLFLTGLLPDKEVAVEGSWKISNATAQAVCLLEGLISHDLTGRLKEVKDGHAIIAISGKASGIELGASVKLEITATLRYDLLSHRLASIEWKQKDLRDQGPASPAIEAESTTIIKRELLGDEPKEFSKAALASVPSEDDPPELLKLLQHTDAASKYSCLYARDWHIVGETENFLVLRLLDRGDFMAQATIAKWKKADAGKHTEPNEFKQSIALAPGWQLDDVIESGEVPTDEGRWIYRVTAKGELDGAKVIQTYFLLAGANGDQVAITFTMKPGNAAKIGTRDLALVNAIEIIGKK